MSSWLKILHGFSLLLLFGLGLVLIYESSEWLIHEGGSWEGTASLGLVGGSCVCLALFGQKKKTEGVIAATIVSAFWTVGTAVAFAKINSNIQAWTLLLSSILQVASSLLGVAMSSRKRDNDDFLNDDSPHVLSSQTVVGRNYGALSNFVDPIYTSRSSSNPAATTTTTRGNSSSINSHSPTTSPTIFATRTPSPFGMHASPLKNVPLSLASASAATADPKELSASYEALWDKHEPK